MKYPINKEFFPYSRFVPPIRNAKMAGFMGSMMRPPRWVRKNCDREVSIIKENIKSYDGAEIELIIFTPCGTHESAPCLVYCHGGGFFFGGAGYHYKLAKQYALQTPCKVVFVQYRLAPKNPHPTPVEDCYAALRWTFENADKLNADRTRVAVGGDSAGGALAAAVCQMARDRGTDMPLFQLLVYPVTDRRMQTESCKKYTDTPMWNAKLSVKMWKGYVQDENAPDIAYASPMEAEFFANLPSAYVETAEFDCLHDEGVAYAKTLRGAGVEVELNETGGTMHGFDIAEKAPTARAAIKARVRFMKARYFDTENPNLVGTHRIYNCKSYNYITLREKPEIMQAAAEWFASKWRVPTEAYLACMRDYLQGKTELGWYLCLDGENIIGGLGIIENDFHDRPDLSPNICAVYTEEAYRSQGVAGRLLNTAVEDLRQKGISPVYLLTDHTGFYERYGWEFLCMARSDGEENPSKMYVHQ